MRSSTSRWQRWLSKSAWASLVLQLSSASDVLVLYQGCLCLYSADVDQAFESCSGSSVSMAWAWASKVFVERYGATVVQIQRSRKFAYKVGSESWSRGWWVLSLDQMGAALRAAASMSFACLGDAVFEMHGMSIGSTMSGSAVSVRFACEEAAAFAPERLARAGFQGCTPDDVQWCRYVDDIVSFSRSLCSTCLGLFFKTLFAEPLSEVYSSDKDKHSPCTWLHFELHVRGQQLTWALKNVNRSYVHLVPGAKLEPTFVAWPGALPMHFRQLRGVFVGKMALAWSSSVRPLLAAIHVLELLLELRDSLRTFE